MNKTRIFILSTLVCGVSTKLYAPLEPVELLSAISKAQIDGKSKVEIAVGWVKSNPTLLANKVAKAALKTIFGGADLDDAVAKANAEVAKQSGSKDAPSAALPKPVSEKIDAVKGAADKKAATKAALTEIGQQIGKGIATASALSADEVGAALVAGMKK